MALRSHVPHRSRIHRPPAPDDEIGWQETRRKYIDVYCDELKIWTERGRSRCEKVCSNHFCCFDTPAEGYNCQYDKDLTCEVDPACQLILAGLLDNDASLSEDNDIPTPSSEVGFNVSAGDFGEVPPPLIEGNSHKGDSSTDLMDMGEFLGHSANDDGEDTMGEMQEMKEWYNTKKEAEENEPLKLKGNLIFMELEEEMGVDHGVVRKFLTRTYDPADPRTTCYDYLHKSDENGDGILQKYEYTNFISDLSKGGVQAANFVDFTFAFKVNFIYLSCQCKFHSNSEIDGGDECCLGPDAGISISGAGPEEVPSPGEDAHLQLVCLTAQGTIDYERDEVTAPTPTLDPVSDSPTKISNPTKEPTAKPSPAMDPVSGSPTNKSNPTKEPTAKPTPQRSSEQLESQVSGPMQLPTPTTDMPTSATTPEGDKPTHIESLITTSPNSSWRPSSFPSIESSHLIDSRVYAIGGDAGDTQSGPMAFEVVVGIMLCVIIVGLYTGISLVDKLGKQDIDEHESEVFLNDGIDDLNAQLMGNDWKAESEADREVNNKMAVTNLESTGSIGLQPHREDNDSERGLEDSQELNNTIEHEGVFEAFDPTVKCIAPTSNTEDSIPPNTSLNSLDSGDNSSGNGESRLSSSVGILKKHTEAGDESPQSEDHLNHEQFTRSEPSTPKQEDEEMERCVEVNQEENTEIQNNRVPQLSDATLKSTILEPVIPTVDEDSTLPDISHSSFDSVDDYCSARAIDLSSDSDYYSARASVENDDDSSLNRLTPVEEPIEERGGCGITHIPLKIHPSQQDSQPVAGNVTEDEIIAAVEAGGWADEGALAAQLADETSRSHDHALARDPFVSFGSDTDTENTDSLKQDMIMRIDWGGVVSAAAQIEQRLSDGTAHTPLGGEPQQTIQPEQAANLVRRVVLDEIVLWLRRRCCVNIDQ